MAISYKPMLKLLIDLDMKKSEIVEKSNISWSTMAKINKGEYVSLEVIDRICGVLNVQPGQLIEFIPNVDLKKEK